MCSNPRNASRASLRARIIASFSLTCFCFGIDAMFPPFSEHKCLAPQKPNSTVLRRLRLVCEIFVPYVFFEEAMTASEPRRI